MAPELPGALDVIRLLTSRGVVVSTGHSMATYDEAVAGFDAGARYGTHLFNRCPPLVTAIWAARRTAGGRPDDGRVHCDGIHTHRAVIGLVWRMLGPKRLNPRHRRHGRGWACLQDGTASASNDVIVDATSCRPRRRDPAGSVLAGSILEMDQALRNLIAVTGCALGEALETMTTTPARLLGLEGSAGGSRPASWPIMVLLSSDLRVQTTITSGELVYSPPDWVIGVRHDSDPADSSRDRGQTRL